MKLLFITSALLFGFLTNANAQGRIRFEADQLTFELVDNTTGESTSCEHKILSHVPWWKVTCDDRQYTVDAWLQIRSRSEIFEKTLMFHVSEGVKSSSQKLVQFKSHMTSFISRGESQLLGIISRIDVRNGLADLVVTIK